MVVIFFPGKQITNNYPQKSQNIVKRLLFLLNLVFRHMAICKHIYFLGSSIQFTSNSLMKNLEEIHRVLLYYISCKLFMLLS